MRVSIPVSIAAAVLIVVSSVFLFLPLGIDYPNWALAAMAVGFVVGLILASAAFVIWLVEYARR